MLPEFCKSVLIFVLFAILSIDAFAVHGDTKKCPRKDGNFPIPGSSCVSFYICRNWIPIREGDCRDDMHFNANREECVLKDLYPCLEIISESKRKKCPRPYGKFLKPGSECRKYFDCCDGKPKEKNCPYSQLFDQKRGKCNYEELVTCKESKTSKESSSKESKESGSEETFKRSTVRTTKIPKSKECPKADGRFVKHSSNCKKYFDCRKGKPTERKCPKYKLFDVKRQLCDYEELVTCNTGKSSEESSKESKETFKTSTLQPTKIPKSKECPMPDGRFVKPSSNCKKYFDCRKGKPNERKCPKYKLFDVKRQLCDYAELVTCNTGKSSEESSKESEESFKTSTLQPTKNDVSKESSSDESRETYEYRESTLELSTLTETESTFQTISTTPDGESTQDKISSRWSIGDNYSSTSDISSFSDIGIESTTERPNKLTSEDFYSSQPPQELTSTSTTDGFFSSRQTREQTPISTSEEIFTGAQTREPIPDSTPEESFTSRQTRDPIPISTLEEFFTSGLTRKPIPDSTSKEFFSSGRTREPITESTFFSSRQTRKPIPDSTFFSNEQTRKLIPDSTPEEFLTSRRTREPIPYSTFSSSGQTREPIPDSTFFSSEQTREPIPDSTFFSSEQTREPIPDSTFFSSEQTREPIPDLTFFSSEQTKEPIPDSTFFSSEQTNEPIPDSTPEELFTNGQTRKPTSISTPENDLISSQTEQPISFKTFSETTTEIDASDSTSETETSFDFDNFVCPEPTGYFPHPTDNKKFIGCVHDKPYIMDCPSNLIYNDKYKRCIHQ